MNYYQIYILLLQGLLAAFVILLLFKLRNRFGLGMLFACLGLFQFVHVFLSGTVSIPIVNNFTVAPGSSVFFTATLFALLIIYIKEDASEIKKTIYTLIIVNIVMAIFLQTFSWSIQETSTLNLFRVSMPFFDKSVFIMLEGSIALFLDSLAIIIIFEFLSKYVRFLFLQICITMLVVVSLHTLLFSIISFRGSENLNSIIISGIISKGFFVIFYSVLFYIYLKYIDSNENKLIFFTIKDIFQPLTYKQKFEFVSKEIKKVLELAEKKDLSLKEVSKAAKIGYWEYDEVTGICTWSNYIYHILGIDSKDGVLPRNEAEKIFDVESQKKLKEAILNIGLTGVSNNIELNFINFKKKEIWILIIAHPIYNLQHKIIGRRGIVQDITIQKITEREVYQKEAKLYNLHKILNNLQKLNHIGSWKMNWRTKKIEWSDEMYKIYGVTKGAFYPSLENINKMVLPEDRYKKKQNIISVLINKKFTPIEFSIKRPSGEIRNLSIQGIERNSKKNIYGVTMDITERKQIKEKIALIQKENIALFENAAISILKEDFTPLLKEIEALIKLEIPNIKTYLEQHPELVALLIKKIKIISVNSAAVKLFKAKNSQEFLDYKHNTLGKGAVKVFENLIVSIWNKDKIFTSEVNYKKLNGDEFAALVSLPIPLKETKNKIVSVSIQSIQGLKEANRIKEESINKLNNAQKIAHIGNWLFNTESQEREWSNEMFYLWDIDLKKGAPKNDALLKQIHIDDQELFKSAFTDAITKGIPYDIEFRIYLSNGTQKRIRSICKPMLGYNGKVVKLTGTTQDITKQKQAIDKIKKAEEMYRLLTDNSNDLICLHESNSTFKYISPSIKTILGYESSDFLGKTPFRIIHNDDILYIKDTLKKSRVSGIAMGAISFRVLHQKGHYVWLEFLASPVYIDKKISDYVTSARDITLRVKARQEIEEYQRSLQKLTTETTLIEEKQKKEIASNIHDHLSQSLVISKMKINELKKNPQLKVIDEDLKFIETHISEALENTRKITYELSPPVLYQLGILEALNWLLEEIEETHKIKCNLNSTVAFLKLSEGKSILLYRSIQEVLTNIIKYAKASFINLDLDKNKLGLHILITDNGVGFDTSVLNNYQTHTGSGFGLFTVQERIRNIQGTFMITSQINVGTTVKIFIPLSK